MSRGVPAYKIMGSLLSKIYLVGLFLLNSWWLSKHLPTARPRRYTTSPAMFNPVGCWLFSGTNPDPDKPANKAMAPTRPATLTGHRHPLPTLRVWKGQLGRQGMEVPGPLPQVSLGVGPFISERFSLGAALGHLLCFPSARCFFAGNIFSRSWSDFIPFYPDAVCQHLQSASMARFFHREHLPAWLPVPPLALPHTSTHVRAHGLRAPTRGRCFARGLTWLLFSLVWCVQCMSWQHLTRGRGAGHAVPVCREYRCPVNHDALVDGPAPWHMGDDGTFPDPSQLYLYTQQ